MYVPSAKKSGTDVVVFASIFTAVAVVYFEIIGIRFFWKLPVLVAVGIMVG